MLMCLSFQAAEQHNMDTSLAIKKGKKRPAPNPPNPFTGEIEPRDQGDVRRNPFDDDVEADLDFEEVC